MIAIKVQVLQLAERLQNSLEEVVIDGKLF
jgi:hypothetical protein